jgi:predicted ABC-type ATPase
MPSFEEDKHPRSPDGKFTAGGEGLQAWAKGGNKGGESKSALQGWSRGQDHAGKMTAPEKGAPRRWVTTGPKQLAAETWMGNYSKHPWEGGKASQERIKAVHDPIMRAALDGVKPPAPGEQKMAIFTMGGPGSGKSSMIKGVDPSKFVHIDPDEVRTKLPEYKQATQGPMIYRYASSMTHPEASDIARKITEAAIAQGKHMIIDGTGGDAASLIAKMDQLRKAGYHIHLAYAHLDGDEGVKRVNSRAEATGRYVPESFVRDSYNKIPCNFEQVAAKADTWAMHDTSAKDAPVVWKKGEDGQEVQNDTNFVSAFRKRYSQAN